MVYLILDANAIGVDPPFGKLQHRLLLDAHRSGEIVLIVPRLALREAINIWRSKLASEIDKLENVTRTLVKLAPAHHWIGRPIDCGAATQQLLGELSSTLEGAGVEMPGTPKVSHEALIERALARRQPFDSKGSGYRDALLWHIVRDHALPGDQVVFVSNDASAYAAGRQSGAALASVLADELAEGCSVHLYSQTHQAIGALGLVHAEALDAVNSTIKRIGGDFAAMLRDRLVEDLAHPVPSWVIREFVNPFFVSGAALGVAFDATNVSLLEARRMEDGRLEADVVLTVRQWVSVWMPSSVADRVHSVASVVQVSQDGVDVGTEFAATVEHRCLLVLDPLTDDLDVEALDVTSVKP